MGRKAGGREGEREGEREKGRKGEGGADRQTNRPRGGREGGSEGLGGGESETDKQIEKGGRAWPFLQPHLRSVTYPEDDSTLRRELPGFASRFRYLQCQ